MPSCATSCCWRRSTNWNAGVSGILRASLATERVFVRRPPDHWSRFEVVFRGWGRREPLESGRAPGIGRGLRAVEHRPDEIEKRQQVSARQDRSPRRRQDVPHLKLGQIHVITAWHAEYAEYELREERQIEAEKDQDG